MTDTTLTAELAVEDAAELSAAEALASTNAARADRAEAERDEWKDAAEHWKSERKLREIAYDVRDDVEGLVRSLQIALVAMVIASKLPGVADEYDFSDAIDSARTTLLLTKEASNAVD